MASMVNGRDIQDGMETFKKLFIICVENLMRDKNKSKSVHSNIAKGKGLVGVLPDKYQPFITRASERFGNQIILRALR